MANSGHTELEHREKQKKKKLPDGYVYSVVNKNTEMHPLSKVMLGDKDELGKVIEDLFKEIATLNGRIDKAKEIIEIQNNKMIELEKRLKEYGI